MKIKMITIAVVAGVVMSCQAENDIQKETVASITSSVNQDSHDFSKLDKYFATLADKEKVLGSFAIYKNGKEIFDKAYIVNGDKYQETDDTYRYKIGSISKTFTSTLVFQLIDEGKLRLDTKLAKYFPEIKNSEDITIKMMLNHHSGIFNYTSHEDFFSYYQEPQTADSMVKRIAELEPAFKPGEKGDYSNSNYLLLGYILESITGKDYGTLVKEKIANPLGLKETYLEEVTEPEKNEVFAFVRDDGWHKFPQWEMSTADAAGAIVSTTHDLNVFFKAIFDGELLSKESFETMIETEDTYGHGIFKREVEYDGKEYVGYWHNGRIERFSSGMMYFPEEKIGIAGLMNADVYDGSKVFKTVRKAAFGQDFEIPEFKDIQLTKEQLEVYVGEYSSDTHPLGIKVMVEGSTLKAQADGQGSFPLTAIDDDTFEFAGAGIEIKFDPDKKQFVIKQGGRADVFTQKSNVKEVTEKKISETILSKYVGVYKSDDFPLDIEIKLEDGNLKAQATGQPAFPLTPETERKFKFELADIVIEFEPNKDQLIITQRGKANIMKK